MKTCGQCKWFTRSSSTQGKRKPPLPWWFSNRPIGTVNADADAEESPECACFVERDGEKGGGRG